MTCFSSLRPLSQKVKLIYLLCEPELGHPVNFADHHFHLIYTEMTKVQDAHDVRVLQLAGSRQDLLWKQTFMWKRYLSHYTWSFVISTVKVDLRVVYLARGVTHHWGWQGHPEGRGSLTRGWRALCCHGDPEGDLQLWDQLCSRWEEMQHPQLSACLYLWTTRRRWALKPALNRMSNDGQFELKLLSTNTMGE